MSGAFAKSFIKVGSNVASGAAKSAKAVGKAAGAAASAAAGTAAKNAADRAKTLAKQSDSLSGAAKSASKSGDDIVGASATTSKATKQLDSAADVGKRADDVADAGGDAAKAGKKADDVADAAKTGKKGMDATTVAKYTAAGGLAYYVSEQIGAANKKVGDCIENCLPDNWASYEYEEIEKDQLNFKSLEELQAEDPEYDEPICSAKINDGKQGPCPTFCSKTCNEKYDKGVLDALGPAGDVIKETTGAAGDVMEQTLDDLGLNPFGPGGVLEGMKETATRAIFIILCICCLSILLKLLGIF
uniref:Uncharacterized protein n=1 Tax=Micromonas commoda virus TaxID=3057169 RepID=A0AAU7YN49_9PHYC